METKTAARVGAEWWGDAVCGKPTMASSLPAGALAMRLAAGAPAPAPSTRTLFVDALTKLIDERISASGECFMMNDVFPFPGDILKEACVGIAGSDRFWFPAKTLMTITPERVTVRSGYRAPYQRLLGAPRWSVVLVNNFGDGMFFVYVGSDETEARRLFKMARGFAKAVPGALVSLWLDGNDVQDA